jgi:hypothetical protein
MNVVWNEETLADVRKTVEELRASGKDWAESPQTRFLVVRLNGDMHRELAAEGLTPLIPISGETEFVCAP